jgi:hypothetical protein
MNPSLLIIAGAVALGVIVLIIGFSFGRKSSQTNSKSTKGDSSRSRVYEVQMRDHRNSFITATVLTVILVSVALLEWSSYQFRNEWPSLIAPTTSLRRGQSFGRGDADYYVDAWYRFDLNGTRYSGSGRLSYAEESRRNQAYDNLNSGSGLRVWYHPLIPHLNLPWKIGPVFAIIVLTVSGLTALGMVSSGVALISTKMKGGPKQKPPLKI